MAYTEEQIALAKQWQDWHEMDESETIDASNTFDDGIRAHHQHRAQFAFENMVRIQAELEDRHNITDTDLDALLISVLKDEVQA